jgi:Flp pilus assembly CpaF family ATPase
MSTKLAGTCAVPLASSSGCRCPTSSRCRQTRQPNLERAGEIPLRRLVKEALRMRPSRIVVGEVRQEECLDLLIALNSGLPGIQNSGSECTAESVRTEDAGP